MLHIRHYHCLECGKDFTASDGVICLPHAGVKCPHCGSIKTVEGIAGSILGKVKSKFGL